MVVFTERAIQEARRLSADIEAYRHKHLRVYLEGKGCDGFYYGVAFDEELPGDLSTTQEGIKIVIDPDSYRFLKRAIIDFVDDDRGRGFLVENPDHRKFRGKFYKSQFWKAALSK